MAEVIQQNGVYEDRVPPVMKQFPPMRFDNWTEVMGMMNVMDLFKMIIGKRAPSPRQGRWEEFNKHAILIAAGTYVNDYKHGHWQEFYDSGELMLEEEYENGEVHGRFATYHPNGKLLSEGRYVNGLRNGQFRVYDEDGQQVRSLLFVHNKLVGEVIINVNAYESS